jgi:sortase A
VGSVEYVRRGLITGVLGRILLGAGVLIFLFVAYQLWGTGFAESHSQAVLRQRLDAQLHHVAHPTTTTTTKTSATTTTTTASSGDQPTVGPAIAAPNDGQPVGILKIDKIGLDKVIVQGTSTSDLREGPGHYPGTPLPGEQGNAAIAGHRTTYGAPFYNLDELEPGNLIQITTVQGLFTYRVTGTTIVSPSDTAVVDDTSTPQLTLTTCNPRFSASQRLVVHALLTTAPAPTARPPKAAPRSESSTTTNDLAGGSQDDWTPVWRLGLLAALVITAVFVVARRRRARLQRWTVYVVGGALSLVVLFFFFGAVSPLLPASF